MDENYDVIYDENDSEQASPNETKAEKFTRLAPARVNKVIDGLRSLQKLSSSAYEYTPEQIEKIFGAIRTTLEAVEASFAPKEKSTKSGFSFD